MTVHGMEIQNERLKCRANCCFLPPSTVHLLPVNRVLFILLFYFIFVITNIPYEVTLMKNNKKCPKCESTALGRKRGSPGSQQLEPDLGQPDQPGCLGDPLRLHRMRLYRGMDREPQRPEEVQAAGLERISRARCKVYGLRCTDKKKTKSKDPNPNKMMNVEMTQPEIPMKIN